MKKSMISVKGGTLCCIRNFKNTPGFSENLTKAFLSLLIVVTLVSAKAQTIYYVNDGSTTGDVFTTAVGSNSNSGSASDPFATIDYAFSQASNGDVIKIDAGTYLENIVLMSKKVTLMGAGNTTILTKTPPCSSNSNGDGIIINVVGTVVRDMKITNFARGIVVQSQWVVINNVEAVYNCSYGIALGLGANNLTVKNSKINNNSDGFRAGTGHHLKKLKVDSCEVKGNLHGTAIYAASSGNMFDSITISNCNFSNNTRKGMYFEKLSNALIENNIMDNSGNDANYAFNNGIDINLRQGSYSNITIRNNELTNCGALGTATNAADPAAMAIKGRDDASNGGSLNNLIIRNNIIKGPRNGIRLGQTGQTNSTPTNVSITENNFGNSFANKVLINFTSNTVNTFTCNWFGTLSLSTINTYITGSTTYKTILVNGTDNSAARGFQPTPVTLTVSAGPDKTYYFDYTDGAPILTANASGGSGYYAYSWSPGGATTKSIAASPTSNTTYTVTVTDTRGCVNSSSDDVNVTVVDITCTIPNYGSTVYVCENGTTTQCVSNKSVKNYIPPYGTGYVGPCVFPKRSPASKTEIARQLLVIPNPSTGVVNIILPNSKLEQNVRILNSVGQVVHQISTMLNGLTIDLSHFNRGVYYVESSSLDGTAIRKLVLN